MFMGHLDSAVYSQSLRGRDRPWSGESPGAHASLPGASQVRGDTSRLIHFLCVYYILIVGTILNFFLTKDPYGASRDPYNPGGDGNFLINQPRIIGIAFLIYFLLIRYVNIDYKIFAICLFALISG